MLTFGTSPHTLFIYTLLSLHVCTTDAFAPPHFGSGEIHRRHSALHTARSDLLKSGGLVASSVASAAGSSTHSSSGITSSTAILHTTHVTSSLPVLSTAFAHSSALSISMTTTHSGASAAQLAQTIDPSTAADIALIHERRLSTIVGSATSASKISAWLSTLGPDGKWPDSEVNYATGCDAQRANWPAQTHWQRLQTMAAGWHGGLKGATQFAGDSTLRAAISLGMDFWFANDFTGVACLDNGGQAACPCGTPGFWNTNWFSNIIGIPQLSGATCLLLNDTLSSAELANCTRITSRAYGTFDHNINGVGFLTGANTLDLATAGIDQGLLNVNASLIEDAYRRVHNEVVIEQAVKADGIRSDGSFGQHGGILYNGNYGKDYINDVLDLEVEAGQTQFAANASSQNAVATLFDADQWMIFINTVTGVLHWDFSVLGRFISFPVVDNQATGSIKINLTEVQELGNEWQSETLINFTNNLLKNVTNANAGSLTGNRMFYANDYMVHRGQNYVTTVKMYSSRTQNTECTNSQNPLGFHLSDGTVYTYTDGNDYEDISAAWDWNLIPGITVDYAATPLECGTVQNTGIENFVGGVSDGTIGIAAMRFTNPLTKSLHWQKAWFFFHDDVQHVMVSDISSSSSAPVYSVLDQKRHVGDVVVDGLATQTANRTGAHSLWHNNVGYTFGKSSNSFGLSVQIGQKTGAWSVIGTSKQPPATVDLFAAWIDHTSLNTSVAYTIFPGTDLSTFQSKSSQRVIKTVQNDAHISAAVDETYSTVSAVFWDATGGSLHIDSSGKDAALTLTATGNVAVIYNQNSGNVTVSDPSQTLKSVTVTLSLGQGRKRSHWGAGRTKTLVFNLPSSGLAGSSVTKNVRN